MSARRIGWSIFAVLAVIVVLVSTASLWAPKLASEKPEPTTEATQGAETAPPADTRNGFSQPNPDGPQAVEQPTKPTYAQQSIAPLPAQHPDHEDPKAVATAFLKVYNSRASESDDRWEKATRPWLTPDLASQLPQVPNGAVADKTPTTVSDVKIKGNVEDWGTDTPLRWSHYVQVTMRTQDQGTYHLNYRIRQQLTDQGWLINAAPLDDWQRVTDEK